MVSIELTFPPSELALQILRKISGIDEQSARALVRLCGAIGRIDDGRLREVASTRTLITAATLIAGGLTFRHAATAAIVGPLTDDFEMQQGLATMVEAHEPTVR